MKLNKFRLFEFNESSWMPSIFRRYITDFLSKLWCFDGFGMTKPAITPVIDLMEKSIKNTKAKKIVDLASGSGEPCYHTLLSLKEKGVKDLTIVLSDLFPNIESFKKISEKDKKVSYEEKPTDAMKCNLDGFRTFFASFHHFNEKQATKIIKDAVDKKEGIGIFELTYKGLWNILFLIGLGPLWIFLITPVVKPLTLGRIIFTYLIPIIPLALCWDGFVSVLRTYSEKEMKNIIKKADPDNTFTWQTKKGIYGLPKVIAIVGYPKEKCQILTIDEPENQESLENPETIIQEKETLSVG